MLCRDSKQIPHPRLTLVINLSYFLFLPSPHWQRSSKSSSKSSWSPLAEFTSFAGSDPGAANLPWWPPRIQGTASGGDYDYDKEDDDYDKVDDDDDKDNGCLQFGISSLFSSSHLAACVAGQFRRWVRKSGDGFYRNFRISFLLSALFQYLKYFLAISFGVFPVNFFWNISWLEVRSPDF